MTADCPGRNFGEKRQSSNAWTGTVSDEIVLQGNKHPSAGSIQATVGLLRQLPEELRRKIGFENACRLYRLKP